jgi:hypothetical protein
MRSLDSRLDEVSPLSAEHTGEIKSAFKNEYLLMALRHIRDIAGAMDSLSAVSLDEGLVPLARRKGQVEGIRIVLDTFAEWIDNG